MNVVARTLLLVGIVALLGVVAATPAGARFQEPPTVDIHSAAGLAPDGRSINVNVLASCRKRWTVVEAVVRVSQPSGSGQASFPLTCIKSVRSFWISVPCQQRLVPARQRAGDRVRRDPARQDRPRRRLADRDRGSDRARRARGERANPGRRRRCAPRRDRRMPGRDDRSRVRARRLAGGSGDGNRAVHAYLRRVASHLRGARPGFAGRLTSRGIAQALTFADVDFGGQVFSGVDDDGALDS